MTWLKSRRAKALFKKLEQQLAAANLTTSANLETLGMLCQAYEDYRDSLDTLNREGKTVPCNGSIKQHPAMQNLKTAYEMYCKLAAELTLTPKSAGKIDGPSSQQVNKLKEFFDGT